MVFATMESKYANIERAGPRPPRRKQKACLVLLVGYNALLLTMVVVTLPFVFHYYSSSSLTEWCSMQLNSGSVKDNMKMYSLKMGTMEETVGVNMDAGVEMVRNTDYLGTEVVTYLDFKKSIGAFSIAGLRECYLIGGLDHRLIKPSELVHYLDDTLDHLVTTRSMSPSSESISYEKASDYPIVDRTILPEYMKEDCSDKALYWLRQLDTSTDSSAVESKRAKRSTDVVKVCLGPCLYINV